MPSFDRPLSFLVERINASGPVAIEDYDDDGEWFKLESQHMADGQLFRLLRSRWTAIVASHSGKFALVHCQMGHRKGVWLHYIATPLDQSEYLSGCHQIESW
jgi:hypothetical protein